MILSSLGSVEHPFEPPQSAVTSISCACRYCFLPIRFHHRLMERINLLTFWEKFLNIKLEIDISSALAGALDWLVNRLC